MTSTFSIGGVTIPSSSKKIVPLIVTQDLDGHPVTVWVHVINGSKPGPTLGLFSGQTGEKWFPLQFLPRLVAELNPNEMEGTLLVVPVCNPLTLLSEGRVTQNHAAVNDLNQCYPGTGEWIVEQIAHKIASEIVPKCTAILDFHEGNLFSLYTVAYAIDYPDQSLGERCHELAMAFAPPCIQRGRVLVAPPKGETVKAEYPGAKSLRGYSGITYGIPAITVEIGGAGVNSALEPEWIKDNLRGIKNVMKHLKILKGDMEKPEKILFSRTRTHRLNPRNGGFLVPEKHPETLLRKVIKGEILGRVINAFTFAEVEQIISPCNGYLVYCSIPRPVRPGDYAFGVFDDSDVEFIKP